MSAQRWTRAPPAGITSDVNVTHPHPRVAGQPTTSAGLDWHAIVVLGVVMSVIAAVAVLALGSVVGESTVIAGVIAIASISAWVVSGRARPDHR